MSSSVNKSLTETQKRKLLLVLEQSERKIDECYGILRSVQGNDTANYAVSEALEAVNYALMEVERIDISQED